MRFIAYFLIVFLTAVIFTSIVDRGILAFLPGAALGLALAYALNAEKRLGILENEIRSLRRLLEHKTAQPFEAPSVTEISVPMGPEISDEPFPEAVPREPPTVREEWKPPPEIELIPAEPPGPTQGPDFIRRFLSSGTLLVKTGIVVLFIGVAFLVKYASDRGLLPIEARLTGAALGGIVLIALGWRLRTRREAYALVLQGGGVGIIYLTVFAAFRIYALLPPAAAFAILFAVCAFSAVLAVLQNSLSLAVLGVSGGFLAPIVTSTGGGSHVMLFSYYALLNAGILGIAWFKAWRPLNLVGFAFTFGIGLTWGHRFYTPGHFSSTEPFLILFLLFYTAIVALFALRRPTELKGYVDGPIVFGTPVVVFAQQAAMTRSFEYGTALSAAAMGLYYIGFAAALFRKRPKETRLLCEAFLAIGVALGTIAIPLAFDAKATASLWALEGAALVWVGVRQNRIDARLSGIALQIAAGIAFFHFVSHHAWRPVAGLPILNGQYIGCLLVSLAGLFSSYYTSRNEERLSRLECRIAPLLGLWGVVWWFGGGFGEIDRRVGYTFRTGAFILFASASCVLCDYLRERIEWPLLRYPASALLPAMFLFALLPLDHGGHPLAAGGFIGWPIAFAALYLILYRNEDISDDILKYFHAGALWLIAVLVPWELAWRASESTAGRGSWDIFAVGMSLCAIILSIAIHGERLAWPIAKRLDAYIVTGLGPIALFAWLWALGTSLLSRGDPWPLTYLPLVNPLEVSAGAILFAVAIWLLKLRSTEVDLPDRLRGLPCTFLFGASVFIWLNTILVRCVHYWGGVPFNSHHMFKSFLLQAILSIFWSLTALGVMVFSTRKRIRSLWITGAALLGLVVVKLIVTDSFGRGTLERIVSFIGVGVLILVIGYVAPVPPQEKGASTEK